jgi:hypothetical protein
MLRSLDFGEIPSLNSRYAKSAKNGHFWQKRRVFDQKTGKKCGLMLPISQQE